MAELHDRIDDKIRLLVSEMHAEGWGTDEVVSALSDVIKLRWIDPVRDGGSQSTMQQDFVSDGNEG